MDEESKDQKKGKTRKPDFGSIGSDSYQPSNSEPNQNARPDFGEYLTEAAKEIKKKKRLIED